MTNIALDLLTDDMDLELNIDTFFTANGQIEPPANFVEQVMQKIATLPSYPVQLPSPMSHLDILVADTDDRTRFS